MTKHIDSLLLQRMFRNACSFSNIAYLCEVERTPITFPLDSYSVPGIVNSAFSCEVFLKSLLIFHGASLEDVKKHRHLLADLWKEYKIKDPSSSSQLEQQVILHYMHGNTELFQKKLLEISNAFYNWRYIYEETRKLPADRNFMRYLRDALREKCCAKYYNKTWNEFKENGFKWYE